jgi:pSer/pThr/pTyr-binding forkhead associated (FHA) protein
MPKLIVSLDDKVVEEIPIEKEIITIGRRTDNDICLDNLAISGYHSQISTVLDDCFLEDLNSTNGTFVNSKIIKKHALKDGDVIDIGNHRIKYINHLATSSANSEFEKTLIMTANSERNQNFSDEQEISRLEQEINSIEDDIVDATNENDESFENDSDSARENIDKVISSPVDAQFEHESDDIEINSQPPSARDGRIQILNGKNSGKEIALDKSLTTVGKPDVAVVGITKRNNGYFIIHIDGKEDTPSKLNGKIIDGKAQPLEDHDIIDVAGIKLEFFVE